MRILFATICSVLFLSLGGCNTIGGFGQDVENTGEAIEDASN